MKTYNLITIAAIMLVTASCESTRQTTSDTGTSNNAMAGNTSLNNPGISTNPGLPNSTESGHVAVSATTGTPNQTGTMQPATNQPINTVPATNQSNMGNVQNTTLDPTNASAQANNNMNRTSTETYITAPSNIQSSFSTRYPTASDAKWNYYDNTKLPIDWELTGWPALTNRDYAVMYNADGNTHYAWYDARGNWVGSTSPMKDFTGLPAPVTQMLSSKYAGYKISEVHAETYKDQAGYEIEMNKGTEKIKMVVDATGNILKQKTKTVDAAGNVNKEKIKN